MKSILFTALMLSFFFFACGKKDTSTTDTKKEEPKTEQKQESKPETTSSSFSVELPGDFPLEVEALKKGAVSAVSESGGLKTVTFKPDGLPEDIVSLIDKELAKKGFKKDKEEKSDMLTELAWSSDTKRIGVDITYAGGKLQMLAVSYEPGK